MVEVTWNPLVPKEMREAIEPVIERYLWLVPEWCYQLHIEYWDTETDKDGKSTSGFASITVNDEYRRAALEVYSSWFDGDERDRRYYIIHEFVHLYSGLAGNFFRRLIDNIYPENDRGPLFKTAKIEYSRLSEQATQDMAWVLLNFEDSLAEQFGSENVEWNLRLMVEHSRQAKKKTAKIQPIQSTQSREKAAKVLKQKAPQLERGRNIERAVKEVMAEKKNGKKQKVTELD
jgi:hypothetical protein